MSPAVASAALLAAALPSPAVAVVVVLGALVAWLALDNRRLARSQDALRERAERYRGVFEAAGDGLVIHDARTFAILDVNQRMAELYGWTREELLATPVGRLSEGRPPYSQADAEAWMRRAVAEGPQRFEWRARRRDGALFWVEVHLRAARLGGEDRLVEVVRDVTERRAAEEALAENERRFREMAGLLPQVVYEADAAGRLLFVNQRAFELFGYGPEDLEAGLGVLQMVVPEHREQAARNVARLVAGESPEGGVEYLARRKDGSTFPVAIYSSPVRSGDRVSGFRGMIIDLSERQRADAERERFRQRSAEAQRMEAIGRLAGGIAHDFNNLLTPILAYGAELKEQLGDRHPLSEELSAILDAAGRASALTRQILAFSRRQVLDLRPLDLNAEVASVHQMLRRLIGEDVAVRLDLAPDAGSVRGDAAQLQQVLLNLAVNARDAMPQGGTLEIATRRAALDAAGAAARQGLTAGEHVVMTVRDTGVGMAEEVRRHVFEPFFTTKGQGKGTGLGLATVHGVVKQHGGDVEVASAPGMGTTFTIWFPRLGEAPSAQGPAHTPAPRNGLGTVLLVEDEPVVRRLVESVLRGAGYLVLAAADGAEALERSAAHRGALDLLLTDVVMPGMDGRALRRSLEAARPGLRVLFMSGYPSMPGAPADVFEGGKDPFLAKPFTGAQLLAAVEGALRGR